MKSLFLLIVLTTCGPTAVEPRPYFEWNHPTRPHAVLSDGTTDPVWTDMVEVARQKWSGPLIALGCEDPFQSDDQNDVILIPDAEWTRPDAIGDTRSNRITVKGTVDEMVLNFAYETVLPHELGHAIGLVHISAEQDENSIMHPSNDKTDPDVSDLHNAAISIGCI